MGHDNKTLMLSIPRRRVKHKPLFWSVPRRAPKQMKSRAFNIERWEAKQHVPRIGNINIFKNVTFQNHVNYWSWLRKDVPRAELLSEICALAYTPCMFWPLGCQGTLRKQWKKVFHGESDRFKTMVFTGVPFQNTLRGLMFFYDLCCYFTCMGAWLAI